MVFFVGNEKRGTDNKRLSGGKWLTKKGLRMDKKVRFFKKQFDYILSHSFWVLGVIIFGVLYYYRENIEIIITKCFEDISEINNDIIIGLAISAISGVVSFIISKFKLCKHVIPHIKSMLYIHLSNVYEKKQNGLSHYIIPQIIKLFYSYERVVFTEQQTITSQILEILSKEIGSGKKIVFWIIGDTFSGKTSAVLNLLSDLITKKQYNDLFETIDGHIEYFDFGRDDSDIYLFEEKYNMGKYKDCFLIIDNVHKITQDKGIRAINNVVHNYNAVAMIILMRPPKDFIMQKEMVDEFEKTIAEVGYPQYELKKIHSSDYDKERGFWSFIKKYNLENYSLNGMVLFHFVKMNQKSKGREKRIEAIVGFLNSGEDNYMSLLLRYIIVSSLFTGSFNIDFVVKEIRKEKRFYNTKKFLRELYDVGFLNSYPNSESSYFFFHEELAKFYFEKTYRYNINVYNSLLEKSYAYYNKKNINYFAFLYSFLINRNSSNEKLFETLVININYSSLLKEVKFLLSIKPELEEYCHKELGILYDRCGELHLASKEYAYYYSKSNGQDKVDAFFKRVQVDHSYYALNIEEAKSYVNETNIYSRMLAQYWIIHMNMHYGVFEIDKMNKLLDEMESASQKLLEMHPYDSLHLIRRCFFDAFRMYYIGGVSDYRKLNALRCQKIQNLLKCELEEYQPYFNKFVYGHYLLYELLFRQGIFGETITRDEYDCIFGDAQDIKYDDLSKVCKIIDYALEVYQKAYEFLYKNGDKTYYFVKCRYMETLAASGKYDEPYQFYKDFQAFAKREKVIYYQACAEIYLFKLEFIHLFPGECLNMVYPTHIENEWDKIESHLINAKKYYREADPNPTNKYMEVVLELYEILFYFYKSKDKSSLKQSLKKLEKQCHANNYLRELRIINHITAMNYTIEPYILKNIICYYPIVAQ